VTAGAPGASAPPFLTIVLTGRNDNFGGDFNTRLFRAMRYNHDRLVDAGVSHEFLFVEWRPLSDRPLLADLLRAEFPELLTRLTTVVVDARYHAAFSQNPKVQFHEFIAKNVGIRRARGRFVLTTNTDIYLGRGVVQRLARRDLIERVLYRALRIDLKSGADTSHIDWNVLEDSRNYVAVNSMQPPFFTNASGDFLLLDRETYHRLRGFNEVYRVAKIHVDSNFCMKSHAVGVTLEDVGGPVYHIGLGTLHASAAVYRERPSDAPWGKTRWNKSVLYENPDGWGLGNAPAQVARTGSIYLEFQRGAVPPLADLTRIRRPAQSLREAVAPDPFSQVRDRRGAPGCADPSPPL
jgi:hypothetical protein